MTTDQEPPSSDEIEQVERRAILTNPEALTNPTADDEAAALRPPSIERDEGTFTVLYSFQL